MERIWGGEEEEGEVGKETIRAPTRKLVGLRGGEAERGRGRGGGRRCHYHVRLWVHCRCEVDQARNVKDLEVRLVAEWAAVVRSEGNVMSF